MKVLFINTWMHPKNLNSMMNYKDLDMHILKDIEHIDSVNLNDYDCVYSPSHPIDVSKYPMTKFIFGPHFSVFPQEKVLPILFSDFVNYIQPSQWCIDSWKEYPICQTLRMKAIPFGVDTDLFHEVLPLKMRTKVFVYFKTRQPEELMLIENLLRSQNVEYMIFNYDKRYDEVEYIRFLQRAKYGIWLGRHESQGFALEEALSSNIPLFVWDVTTMNQEHGQNYPECPATTVPYFDSSCGKVITSPDNILNDFQSFLNDIDKFSPRQYVLENLSYDSCCKKWIDLIQNM